MVVVGQGSGWFTGHSESTHESITIVGGPPWFDSDDFDIQGVPDVDGQPALKQLQIMVRKLLADRFQLNCHQGRKELAVYAIQVVKEGPKLTQSADPNALQSDNYQRGMGQVTMRVRNMTMAAFATDMDFFMDKPVIGPDRVERKMEFSMEVDK